MAVAIHHGDMLAVLPTLAAESLHACVTDPPYHLSSIVKRFGKPGAAPTRGREAYARIAKGFMGQQWDGGDIAFRPETWAAVLRVLKPGAHLVAFGGTRTVHRMACAIEDAGFEIRDSLLDAVAADAAAGRFMDSLDEEQARAFWRLLEESPFGGWLAWIYATGFPKSHDFGMEHDKALFKDARDEDGGEPLPMSHFRAHWEGWGTALKPAFEPIVLARKPLAGTVAETVLRHGCGGLNIDGCKINGDAWSKRDGKSGAGFRSDKFLGSVGRGEPTREFGTCESEGGRWPANVLTDGSPEVVAAFPWTRTNAKTRTGYHHERTSYLNNAVDGGLYPADSGSAARFFFSAKADAGDRVGTKHPTVKPVDLMRWIVRLLTPPGGTVLDPFAGSGTTGEACHAEGLSCVLIEREAAYVEDIRRRMERAVAVYDPLFTWMERKDGAA